MLAEFRRERVQIVSCDRYSIALETLRQIRPELLFVNVGIGNADESLELVATVREAHRELPIVMSVQSSSEELAIAALNVGVTRYLRHPVAESTLNSVLRDLLPSMQASTPPPDHCLSGGSRFVGASASVCALRASIARAARCSSNVLITGETGTGKEVVAELIHENSSRRDRPFVCLNSTAIPDSLLESELFGHEKGAFTGAHAANQGKLALANTGTVFFDEIGDIGATTQAKLLRALDGKQIYRLGGTRPFPLDVRLLTATNQNLEEAVENDRFRRDLYYRLYVIRLDLPPLRHRKEDIPALVAHFTILLNRTFGTQVKCMTREALDLLLSHDWPGNIRELRNVLEVAFVNLPSSKTEEADLPEDVKRHLCRTRLTDERDELMRALVATNWNKTKAADRLHWSRMTLYRRLNHYKISPQSEGLSKGRDRRSA